MKIPKRVYINKFYGSAWVALPLYKICTCRQSAQKTMCRATQACVSYCPFALGSARRAAQYMRRPAKAHRQLTVNTTSSETKRHDLIFRRGRGQIKETIWQMCNDICLRACARMDTCSCTSTCPQDLISSSFGTCRGTSWTRLCAAVSMQSLAWSE